MTARLGLPTVYSPDDINAGLEGRNPTVITFEGNNNTGVNEVYGSGGEVLGVSDPGTSGNVFSAY